MAGSPEMLPGFSGCYPKSLASATAEQFAQFGEWDAASPRLTHSDDVRRPQPSHAVAFALGLSVTRDLVFDVVSLTANQQVTRVAASGVIARMSGNIDIGQGYTAEPKCDSMWPLVAFPAEAAEPVPISVNESLPRPAIAERLICRVNRTGLRDLTPEALFGTDHDGNAINNQRVIQ